MRLLKACNGKGYLLPSERGLTPIYPWSVRDKQSCWQKNSSYQLLLFGSMSRYSCPISVRYGYKPIRCYHTVIRRSFPAVGKPGFSQRLPPAFTWSLFLGAARPKHSFSTTAATPKAALKSPLASPHPPSLPSPGPAPPAGPLGPTPGCATPRAAGPGQEASPARHPPLSLPPLPALSAAGPGWSCWEKREEKQL